MKEFDFIGNRTKGYAFSSVLVGGSLLLLLFRGLNYGIDFKGGSIFHYRFKKQVTEDQIRHALAAPNLVDKLGEVKVQSVRETDVDQIVGTSKAATPASTGAEATGRESEERWPDACEYIVHTQFAETTEEGDLEGQIDNALAGAVGEYRKLRTEKIGPTIGKMLQRKAAWAVFLGVLIILFYVSVRFQADFAVASVVALIHDCLATLGVFALLQREVNIDILAALLTILGYSLNDTIVILDRIRENLRLKRKSMGFAAIVNLSINQSLSRTINTSLTTLLPVMTLLLFGGSVISGFALALLIGVVVGTYSSVFIVSPIIVYWYYRTHPGMAKKEEEAAATA